MNDLFSGLIGRFVGRSLRDRLDRAVAAADEIPLGDLRRLRTQYKPLLQRLIQLNHRAEGRLARPHIGSTAMNLPPSTDYSHRPDAWRGPISPAGRAPARNEASIGADATLYHDSRIDGISLRQVRNSSSDDLAAFGVVLDVLGYDGSFLSVVLRAPDGMIHDLHKRHVMRVSLRLDSERETDLYLRANLKHGPNTTQETVKMRRDGAEATGEFDLAYSDFIEGRVEHIWFDIFFEDPALNQFFLRDLTLSRHIRANA